MILAFFAAESSVEGFDDRIVRGLAASAEVQDHAAGIRAQIHCGADELRTVVAIDPL